MPQHIHKYRRVDIGRDKEYWVMQCGMPKCNHYVAMDTKLSAPALIGKASLCNKCSSPFELDRAAIRKAKPVCSACIVSSKQKEADKAARFFQSLERSLAVGFDE